MDKEITLFITSCGRPGLLKRTLESFVKYNTYPIKEAILCEDSGIPNIVDFVKNILPYPIIFCYNLERIGQMKTNENN
uniref:Glycosyltransferase 2-like domain-containing protein n=1 Tax=viral metagenome TaxID=1070528 RepID=A0A6C0AQL4_9ZZZZ